MSTMNAVLYTEPRKFEVKKIPLPEVADDEVLFKGISSFDCSVEIKI